MPFLAGIFEQLCTHSTDRWNVTARSRFGCMIGCTGLAATLEGEGVGACGSPTSTGQVDVRVMDVCWDGE